MPNIQALLKSEISRIARKEIKSHTDSLKKASTQYRSHIAALKRQVAALEARLKKQSKSVRSATAVATDDGGNEDGQAHGLRFRAKGFAAHRQRLELSAAQAGALLDVSPLTVYKWEKGEAKPRASHMPRIAAFRKLGKKQAIAALEQMIGAST